MLTKAEIARQAWLTAALVLVLAFGMFAGSNWVTAEDGLPDGFSPSLLDAIILPEYQGGDGRGGWLASPEGGKRLQLNDPAAYANVVSAMAALIGRFRTGEKAIMVEHGVEMAGGQVDEIEIDW